MAKFKKIDISGKSTNDIEIKNNLLIEKPHSQAIFESIIAENAGKRQGTHSTLTKGEVRGGGKKPYAQKHTGNARQGSIRNPHYVGGGIVFGPKPTRNYKIGVNKKVVKLALSSAFSDKANNIFVLEDGVKLTKPSTKTIITLLKTLNVNNQKILFVINKTEENLYKSTRNINRAVTKFPNQVSPKDFLHAQQVIIQESALKELAKAVA